MNYNCTYYYNLRNFPRMRYTGGKINMRNRKYYIIKAKDFNKSPKIDVKIKSKNQSVQPGIYTSQHTTVEQIFYSQCHVAYTLRPHTG